MKPIFQLCVNILIPGTCAAAIPPTQFGSEKARGRSYLR